MTQRTIGLIGLIGGLSWESSPEYYRIVNAAVPARRGTLIARLVDRGAEAVIPGCTEIMLLVGAADSAVPLFDTTSMYADAVVARALQSHM